MTIVEPFYVENFAEKITISAIIQSQSLLVKLVHKLLICRQIVRPSEYSLYSIKYTNEKLPGWIS